MSFWIRRNSKVKAKIRIIASTIYYVGVLFYILYFIIRMQDKANHVVSEMQKELLITFFSIVGLYLLLNFVHWLKPKWFENKNKEA